jgi:hypothetical protein
MGEVTISAALSTVLTAADPTAATVEHPESARNTPNAMPILLIALLLLPLSIIVSERILTPQRQYPLGDPL